MDRKSVILGLSTINPHNHSNLGWKFKTKLNKLKSKERPVPNSLVLGSVWDSWRSEWVWLLPKVAISLGWSFWYVCSSFPSDGGGCGVCSSGCWKDMTSLVTCWGLRVVGEYIAGQEVKDSTERKWETLKTNWTKSSCKKSYQSIFKTQRVRQSRFGSNEHKRTSKPWVKLELSLFKV